MGAAVVNPRYGPLPVAVYCQRVNMCLAEIGVPECAHIRVHDGEVIVATEYGVVTPEQQRKAAEVSGMAHTRCVACIKAGPWVDCRPDNHAPDCTGDGWWTP